MVINDKALAQSVKRWAKAGLKIWWELDALRLSALETRFAVDLGALSEPPRMTLAALVELLGFMPEGRCIEVTKTSSGVNVQEVMERVMAAEFPEIICPESYIVRPIPLRYKGMTLFQYDDCAVYGVKSGDLYGVAAKTYWTQGALFVARDDESSFSTLAYRPEGDERWRALESVDWAEGEQDG